MTAADPGREFAFSVGGIGGVRLRANLDGMRATLERIKAVVERGQ